MVDDLRLTDGVEGYALQAQSKQVFELGDCREANLAWHNGYPTRFLNRRSGDPSNCLVNLSIHCVGERYDVSFIGPPTPSGREFPFAISVDDGSAFVLNGKSILLDDDGKGESSMIGVPLSADQVSTISKTKRSITLTVGTRKFLFSDLQGTRRAFSVLATTCGKD